MKFFSKIKENPLLSFLIALLVLAFGAFVGVLLSECAEKYISKLLGLCEKNEALKFLGISMGGILIALQALMSYKRAKAMETTAEAQADAAKAQAKATEEQAKANQHTEKGQRQERLKNAIEHLGDDKEPMRLGGTYELLHLAKDTEELRQTGLDILCANIRRTTGDDEYQRTHKSKPSKEVQGLLTLLFVQEYEVFKGCHINLQESWLNGADLQEARLWKATLVGAHLQKADLCRAHLQRANLAEAHLEEASLSEAYLQGADLGLAYLQGAYLQKAHMQGVGLHVAHLQGASLREARLQGAYLGFVELVGANLNQVHLEGARSQAGLISTPFAVRIKMLIGEETDLSRVWFEEIKQEEMASLIAGLSYEKANALRRKLTPHIGKPESHELPQNSGAVKGSYTKKDAERWIAEYEQAMSEVPEDDS